MVENTRKNGKIRWEVSGLKTVKIFVRRLVDEAVLFQKSYPHLTVYLLSLALFLGFTLITGYACPIRFLFGIPCPGCGTMRALECVFNGQFREAFSMHPLWIVILPAIACYIWFDVKGWEKALNILLIGGGGIMVAVYLYRMLVLKSPIVQIDFHYGRISRLVLALIEKIRS